MSTLGIEIHTKESLKDGAAIFPAFGEHIARKEAPLAKVAFVEGQTQAGKMCVLIAFQTATGEIIQYPFTENIFDGIVGAFKGAKERFSQPPGGESNGT